MITEIKRTQLNGVDVCFNVEYDYDRLNKEFVKITKPIEKFITSEDVVSESKTFGSRTQITYTLKNAPDFEYFFNGERIIKIYK